MNAVVVFVFVAVAAAADDDDNGVAPVDVRRRRQWELGVAAAGGKAKPLLGKAQERGKSSKATTRKGSFCWDDVDRKRKKMDAVAAEWDAVDAAPVAVDADDVRRHDEIEPMRRHLSSAPHKTDLYPPSSTR